MCFYTNLSQMAILPLGRYLCRHQDEDPAYLPAAVRLNRWVEDQFVAFGPDEEASPVRVKGQQVFEQFMCWLPMEGHMANWMLSLVELQKATGQRVSLDKAKAAANVICSEQYPDGRFSTWGRDYKTGITFTGENALAKNWYNANAMAYQGLYMLKQYVRALEIKGFYSGRRVQHGPRAVPRLGPGA